MKRLLLGLVLTVLATTAASAENWPGWRGPGRNGVSHEADLPTTWSDTQNVAWKAHLPGLGVGGPIVWGDRIFVTDSDGPRLSNLHVICLSRDSGKELWHDQFWGTAPTLHHETKSSMATPVPVTDGKSVFSFFGTGDVFCTTLDGELVWHRSLAAEYGPFENRFAASSSPLVFDNLVLVQCDHYGASYVLAIDKRTGANAWKVDRPDYWHSWASPQLVPVGSNSSATAARHELILCGSEKLDAFDPATGEVVDRPRDAAGVHSDARFRQRINLRRERTKRTDARRPSRRSRRRHRIAGCLECRPRMPFVPSAIVVGKSYELVDDGGILTCLDALSGTRRWQKRLPGRYTASPIAGDGKIYFFNEDGTATVISATEKGYRQLAQNSIGEPIFATPALSGGRLLIRTPEHLWCIGPNR